MGRPPAGPAGGAGGRGGAGIAVAGASCGGARVEATAGVARELAAATTSGAGLAKKQSKVFDPGGGL